MTRKLILGEDTIIADWVARQIPHMRHRVAHLPPGMAFGPCVGMGVTDGDFNLLGGVVYNNYQPDFGSIDISGASTTPRWLNRMMVSAILRYPFAQLRCRRVTACTPRKATSVRRFLKHLGFKEEGCVRWGFGDDHAVIYGLLAEEWAASPLSAQPSERELNGEVRPLAAASA